MGRIHTSCTIANIIHERETFTMDKVPVDPGSEFTWMATDALNKVGIQPRKKYAAFVMANGQAITRSMGYAIVRVGEHETIDEVVFGLPGDLMLLGARSLEGLNLMVDPARKRLVAAGPRPAA
ncbi:MAG: hypothetical protein ACKVS8_06775 [Phycisphaerales bacterium]